MSLLPCIFQNIHQFIIHICLVRVKFTLLKEDSAGGQKIKVSHILVVPGKGLCSEAPFDSEVSEMSTK